MKNKSESESSMYTCENDTPSSFYKDAYQRSSSEEKTSNLDNMKLFKYKFN